MFCKESGEKNSNKNIKVRTAIVMLIIMKTECIKCVVSDNIIPMYLCGTKKNNNNEHSKPNNMDFGDSFVEINNHFG